MYEIKEFWNHVTPVCGCHGDNKVKMIIHEGPHSLFYSCPKYYPDSREEGEVACNNRINLVEYQKMLEKMMWKIAEAEAEMGSVNLTNFKWSSKGIDYKVLKHENDEIEVEIKNIRAMRS